MITLNNNMQNIQEKEKLSTYNQYVLHRNPRKHPPSIRNASSNPNTHPRDKSLVFSTFAQEDKKVEKNYSREKRQMISDKMCHDMK
jgi:hypothetical protein